MIRSVSARRTRSPTVGPNICAYAARLISWGICSPLQWAHDCAGEAMHQARTTIGNQRDLARLTWLEAHRRPGRDVQAATERSPSVEVEGRVGLGEMIVTSDLDRPVTGVGNREGNDRSPLVQNDLARCWNDLSGHHRNPPQRIGSCRLTSLVPSGKVASTCI